MAEFLSIAGFEGKILVITPEDKIIYVNSAFFRSLNKTREEITGQSLLQFDRFPFGEGILSRLSGEVRKSNRAISFEQTYINPDTGETEQVRISANPISDNIQILLEDRSEHFRLEREFQRYVGPKVLERMRMSGKDFDIPERREITILFVDLRGFTQLADRLPPDDVRTILNEYLNEMIRIVYSHEAMVDKIIGDAVMALFGAPMPIPDHAFRALRCAAEMIETQKRLIKEWEQKGKTMPPCGIGIETGEVVIGDIGSALQRSYTAIGQAVNLASRLCGAARSFHILLTEEAFNRACEQVKANKISTELKQLEDVSLADIKLGFRGQIEDVKQSLKRGKHMQMAGIDFVFLDSVRVKGIEKDVQLVGAKAVPEFNKINIEYTTKDNEKTGVKTFGDYDLEEIVGRGGMGVVYKAKHRILNRYVALKMLTAGEQAAEIQVKRFMQEARSAATLQHSNIIRIYEVSQSEGKHFFTMDYIDGIPLDRFISIIGKTSKSREDKSTLQEIVSEVIDDAELNTAENNKELPTDIIEKSEYHHTGKLLTTNQRVEIIRKVLIALSYAHEKGIVHRDVKPGNIMVSRAGEPVLMDFGLARVRGEGIENLTLSGTVIGTTAYMSPEQAEGRASEIDERTDVYGTGAILYELLTGKRPVEPTGNMAKDLHAIINTDPTRPRTINPDVPEELDLITMKALEKDKNRRYVTADAFAADLFRYLKNEPIMAKPPSITYAVRKSIARHPGIFVTVVTASILLLILAVGSYIKILSERNQAMYQAHLLHGNAYLKDGHLRQAFKEYETAYRSYPGFESQSMLGEISHLRWPLILKITADSKVTAGQIIPGKKVSYLISTSSGMLYLYDSNGNVIKKNNLEKPAVKLAISQDTKYYAAAFSNGKVQLLNASDMSKITTFSGWGYVDNIAFGPGNNILAVLRTKGKYYYVETSDLSNISSIKTDTSEKFQRGRVPPAISFSAKGELCISYDSTNLMIRGKSGKWKTMENKSFRSRYNFATSALSFKKDKIFAATWITEQAAIAGDLVFFEVKNNSLKTVSEIHLTTGRMRDVLSIDFAIDNYNNFIAGLEGTEGYEVWSCGPNPIRLTSMFYNSLWPQEKANISKLDINLSAFIAIMSVDSSVLVFAIPIDVPIFPNESRDIDFPYGIIPQARYTLVINKTGIYSTEDWDTKMHHYTKIDINHFDFNKQLLNRACSIIKVL